MVVKHGGWRSIVVAITLSKYINVNECIAGSSRRFPRTPKRRPVKPADAQVQIQIFHNILIYSKEHVRSIGYRLNSSYSQGSQILTSQHRTRRRKRRTSDCFFFWSSSTWNLSDSDYSTVNGNNHVFEGTHLDWLALTLALAMVVDYLQSKIACGRILVWDFSEAWRQFHHTYRHVGFVCLASAIKFPGVESVLP